MYTNVERDFPDKSRLALDIITKIMFGANVKGQEELVQRALEDVVTDAFQRIQAIVSVPLWVPTPANLVMRKAIADLEQVIYCRRAAVPPFLRLAG